MKRKYNYKVAKDGVHVTFCDGVHPSFTRIPIIIGHAYDWFYFLIQKAVKWEEVEIDLYDTPVYSVTDGDLSKANYYKDFYISEERAMLAYQEKLAYYTQQSLANGWKINETLSIPMYHEEEYDGVGRYFKVDKGDGFPITVSLKKWKPEDCSAIEDFNNWKPEYKEPNWCQKNV